MPWWSAPESFLYDELRPGRPRTIEDEQVASLLKRTLFRKPANGTHWTVREAARDSGISKSTVHRLFQAYAVQPHRTQPVLPMGLGYVEGVTHDYVRHGTTTLSAALDIATGMVFTECKPRHRHQEFLAFLRRLDACIPQDLDVHLIVDNYATHKHAKVRSWLARRPRYHVHYTPTYSSWLNQVERWFGFITQRAIRRGSFRSVQDLVEKIDSFVQQYNRSRRPFVWTATADSILAKVARLCSRISGTRY